MANNYDYKNNNNNNDCQKHITTIKVNNKNNINNENDTIKSYSYNNKFYKSRTFIFLKIMLANIYLLIL